MRHMLGPLLELVTALAMSLSYGLMITYLVLWGKAMPEHAYFMLIFVALFSTVVSLTIALLRKIFYIITKFPDYQQMHRVLNRTYLKFPIPQFIGFMLMINYVLAGFGSPHVSGILQAVLTQGSIPFTIVMSYFLLRRRYNWLQLLGAVVVIAGALLSMKKDLKHESCKSSDNATDFELACYDVENTLHDRNISSMCISGTNSVIWDFLYFVSTLPMGLVNIIMEYFLQYSKGDEALKNKVGEINVPMAVALNNIWLLIWLLLFFWLNLLPEVVPQCAGLAHSMSVFGDNMRTAFQCTFTGKGGYAFNVSTYNATDLHNPDDCTNASLFVMMLALAATVQMILQAYTVQQQSATFTMALVTLGPMFAVGFQNSKAMTMNYYEVVRTDFSPFMAAGLIVVLLGIIMYKVPSILRYFGVASKLHPIESDETDSWVTRKLRLKIRKMMDRVLHRQEEDSSLQGLTSNSSQVDYREGCIDYFC